MKILKFLALLTGCLAFIITGYAIGYVVVPLGIDYLFTFLLGLGF
jgi:hypothetical protein